MMQTYSAFTRSVTIICLVLGVISLLFFLAMLASVIMLYVLKVREPSPDVSPAMMVLVTVAMAIVGIAGILAFFTRKRKRGSILAAIFGGFLALQMFSLPFLLIVEKPGVFPFGSIMGVFLGLLGLWVLLVSLDPKIRAVRLGEQGENP